MADDKVVNFNEHRLHHEFTITSDYGMNYELPKKKKDIIEDILKTMPDKNGYYIPPYN